jgi:acyl-coenzyme A thioesterase PaaI-like protein
MKQANSSHCFVCGLSNQYGLQLSFYDTAVGEVTSNVNIPDHYQGYPGIVHGGIVAALLDEVCGRAHMGGNKPRFMYTARLEIRYRKNVPVGVPLKVIGRVLNSKSRTATSSGIIVGPGEEVLAEADALLVEIPEDFVESIDFDELGWKVYDD